MNVSSLNVHEASMHVEHVRFWKRARKRSLDVENRRREMLSWLPWQKSKIVHCVLVGINHIHWWNCGCCRSTDPVEWPKFLSRDDHNDSVKIIKSFAIYDQSKVARQQASWPLLTDRQSISWQGILSNHPPGKRWIQIFMRTWILHHTTTCPALSLSLSL